MATKVIRALMLPNMGSVLITMIASCVPYDEGVGVLNDRGRMIGWIQITATDPEVRESHFNRVLSTINELINKPRQATQPDWKFLTEEAK